MQPPYTHWQQAYGQYPSTPSHNSGSGYYPSYPGVTDFMTPGFAQGVAPSYNAQSYTTQDIYRDQPAIRTGPGFYGNDAYGGGSISGYGSDHAMAGGTWGTPAPQPPQNSDYPMPSNPYSNLREGEPYYAGYHSGTEQVPGPTMSFSPRFPEADPNQDVSEWRFDTCWVSHAEKDDEIHLNYGNDDYGGGSVSVYGSNHAMAGGPWGTPDPQPLQNSDYSMPNIPYSSNLRQGEPYYAGYHSGAEQVPGPAMSFSRHLPEADPNQDAYSEWRFHTCWVSHAEEDKIHLTMTLKKS